MVEANVRALVLGLDEDGFLRDPQTWDTEVAASLAWQEGGENLTEDDWRVINCLRDYYLKSGVPPPGSKLRKQTGFNLIRICELSPSGLAKVACKIAGLPRPAGLYPSSPIDP